MCAYASSGAAPTVCKLIFRSLNWQNRSRRKHLFVSSLRFGGTFQFSSFLLDSFLCWLPVKCCILHGSIPLFSLIHFFWLISSILSPHLIISWQFPLSPRSLHWMDIFPRMMHNLLDSITFREPSSILSSEAYPTPTTLTDRYLVIYSYSTLCPQFTDKIYDG